MELSQVSNSMLITKKVAKKAAIVTALRCTREYCFSEGRKTRKVVANLV